MTYTECHEPASYWEDDPTYPYFDWLQAVATRSTRLGYWDWVQDQIEDATDKGIRQCGG